jgi:hypothetical protein
LGSADLHIGSQKSGQGGDVGGVLMRSLPYLMILRYKKSAHLVHCFEDYVDYLNSHLKECSAISLN